MLAFHALDAWAACTGMQSDATAIRITLEMLVEQCVCPVCFVWCGCPRVANVCVCVRGVARGAVTSSRAW